MVCLAKGCDPALIRLFSQMRNMILTPWFPRKGFLVFLPFGTILLELYHVYHSRLLHWVCALPISSPKVDNSHIPHLSWEFSVFLELGPC